MQRIIVQIYEVQTPREAETLIELEVDHIGCVGITGRICNWQTARKLVESANIPVILAGGISPLNVTDGIRQVRPAGVDSCTQTNAQDKSGRPIRFRKDFAKVKNLVAEVRTAEKSPSQRSGHDVGQG